MKWKDPTEFRNRFEAWKNGELVYEAGLPKYKDGYDKDSEFLKDWKVLYNGPMLSDRYVRREKPGLKIKGGQLPRFFMGTERDMDMGPKSKTYNKEAVKQILHELPLSPIDPVMAAYLGLTAIGKLFSLGRFYMKNRLSKEAKQDYKQFRRNGYSPAVSRNFVTDTYTNDISKLADKMSRMLDFGL